MPITPYSILPPDSCTYIWHRYPCTSSVFVKQGPERFVPLRLQQSLRRETHALFRVGGQKGPGEWGEWRDCLQAGEIEFFGDFA